jgi:hypothetical protein
MATVTIETCKAPLAKEFPKLTRPRAKELFDEARDIVQQIKDLEAKLKEKLRPRIHAELARALPEDGSVKSVRYDDVLFTLSAGGSSVRLDTKWAKRKLLLKGVSEEEIAEHSKETVREPGVRIQLLGEAGSGAGEEE